MLVRTSDLIDRAVRDGSAVAAFNVITLEHAEAIVAAAEAVERPVILQISENAVHYHRDAVWAIAAGSRALGERSAAEVALHLDHVESDDLVRAAPEAGFSSIMIDASRWSHEENTRVTRVATEWCHDHGLWVEAELGYVGGKPDAPQRAHGTGVRTDPDEARDFVAGTGVDALAVAVGSSHAMTSRTAALDADLISAIAQRVPVPLVLHGSSGVPDEEIRRAIAAGMRKINIGTALNIAYTAAIRSTLAALPDVVDPRKYLTAARDEMESVAAALISVVSR
jgi:fructose-bisphosphate aldolase class II